MRAIVVYFGVIGLVIWLASDGQIDRISTRFGLNNLPSGSAPPLEIPFDSLPNPQDLNSLSIVPAAQADAMVPVRVVGSVVNLRAGPGLTYRMIDVAERDERLLVTGDWIDGWAPVRTMESRVSAWVHGDQITIDD